MISSRVTGALVTIALSISALSAGSARAQVLAPDALLAGISQREWAARWCQWVMPIPVGGVFGQMDPDPTLVGTNPTIETTGVSAYKGAFSGSPDVFFLAGSAIQAPVDRRVTVRTGQYLFFPIINAFADNTNVYGQPPTNFTVDEMLSGAFGVDYVSSFNGNVSLFLTIDGVSVTGLNTHRQTYGGMGFWLPIPARTTTGTILDWMPVWAQASTRLPFRQAPTVTGQPLIRSVQANML